VARGLAVEGGFVDRFVRLRQGSGAIIDLEMKNRAEARSAKAGGGSVGKPR
jgi:hypothetical protein